jgi:hypothetical protein
MRGYFHGRDSLAIQRIAVSGRIQVSDGMVDGGLKVVEVCEGSMRKVTGFQVSPDDFDVIQLGGVFGQPFDGEPVVALGQRPAAGLADVDGTVVEDKHHRLRRRPGSGAVEAVERLQMRDEIGAPLGPGRGDDQLASGVIERAHHCDLLRLSGRGNPKVSSRLGPGTREIGMRQGLALIGKQQHDVASLGLRLEQFQAQPATIHRLGVLAVLQRVAGSAITKAPFFRSALESCDLEIVTPSRAPISSAKRASVQLTRFATGIAKRGSATRKAARVFTGSGPGRARVSKASAPPFMNSLRHRRTVSSRTPKACAMRELVQPLSVKRMLLARSASARSAPPAFRSSSLTCSGVARNGDLPAILVTPIRPSQANRKKVNVG